MCVSNIVVWRFKSRVLQPVRILLLSRVQWSWLPVKQWERYMDEKQSVTVMVVCLFFSDFSASSCSMEFELTYWYRSYLATETATSRSSLSVSEPRLIRNISRCHLPPANMLSQGCAKHSDTYNTDTVFATFRNLVSQTPSVPGALRTTVVNYGCTIDWDLPLLIAKLVATVFLIHLWGCPRHWQPHSFFRRPTSFVRPPFNSWYWGSSLGIS